MGGSEAQGTEGPHLDRRERAQADATARLTADVTYEVIRRRGEEELRRPPAALAFSALAAGLSMGFSLAAEGILRAHLPDAAWSTLVAKIGYSFGFLIVILGSQQLFTENTLTPVVPFLVRRTRMAAVRLVRLWAIVLAGNLIGAGIFAWVSANTTVFEPAVRLAFAEIGREAMRGDFATILVQAVFAGWLIAVTVWMLPAAAGSQAAIVLLMTWLIGASGFAHIVAGAVEVFHLAAAGLYSLAEITTGYLIPTLIGNIIGGVTIVAALNHAQVMAGRGGTGGGTGRGNAKGR